MRLIIIFLAAVAFFTSCRPTRKIQTAIDKKDSVVLAKPVVEDSAAFIRENYSRLSAQHIDFTTFTAKIDVDYVGADGKKENANAILRMYKDSAIWVALPACLVLKE